MSGDLFRFHPAKGQHPKTHALKVANFTDGDEALVEPSRGILSEAPFETRQLFQLSFLSAIPAGLLSRR